MRHMADVCLIVRVKLGKRCEILILKEFGSRLVHLCNI
jgi:hypothetical protein